MTRAMEVLVYKAISANIAMCPCKTKDYFEVVLTLETHHFG